MSWKGRGDIAYRLAWLARQAQGYAVITAAVRSLFAAELGISDRTLRRDLNALEEGGWQIPEWRQS